MEHLLRIRRVPACWTEDHRALLPVLAVAGVSDTRGARPEWIETTTLAEDVDGLPAGLVTTRTAAVTNCPPEDGHV